MGTCGPAYVTYAENPLTFHAHYAESQPAGETSIRSAAYAKYTCKAEKDLLAGRNDEMNISDAIYGLLRWKVLGAEKIGDLDAVVVKKPGRRELVYGHTIHSMLHDGSIYTGYYWDYFLPLPALFKNPSILLMGLGGGTMPFQIESLYDGIQMEIVESEPKMIALSRIFLPRHLRSKVILGEGRGYLCRTKKRYDLILSDTYVGGKIPEGFLEGDFPEQAFSKLKENGVLAINYPFSRKNLGRRRSLIRNLSKLFTVMEVKYGKSPGNAIILCSRGLSPDYISNKILRVFDRNPGIASVAEAYARLRILRKRSDRQ